MFWGLIAEDKKRYTSPSDESFHVSMASLESSGEADTRPKKLKYEGRVAVFVEYGGINYLICTLNPSDGVYQVPLDLNFASTVTFHISCWSKSDTEPVKVHLTGYYLTHGTAGNISYPLSMSTPNELGKSGSTIAIPSKSAQQSILVSGSKAKSKAESGIKKRVSIKETIESASIEENSDEDSTDEYDRVLMNGSTRWNSSLEDDDEDDEEDEDFDEEEVDEEDDEDEEDSDEFDDDEEESDELEVDDSPQLSSKGNTPAAQVSTSASAKKQKSKNKKNVSQTVESDEDAEMITLSDEENELKTSMNIPIKKESNKTEKKDKRQSEGNVNVGNKTPEVLSPKKKKESKGEALSPNKAPNTPTTGLKTPQQKNKVTTPSSVGHTPMKYSTKGGVMIQEVKIGNGPAVKHGKMVTVTYVGRLKNNNKQFDAGDMKFRVGKGEVIKGWDVGLEGMKVGGKRKLNVPSHMGYGKKGAAPAIPPNAPLTFDIELKKVS